MCDFYSYKNASIQVQIIIHNSIRAKDNKRFIHSFIHSFIGGRETENPQNCVT